MVLALPSRVHANRKSDWRQDKAVRPSPSWLARVRLDVRSRLCGCRKVWVVGRFRFRLRSSLRLTRPLDLLFVGAFLQHEVLLVDPTLVSGGWIADFDPARFSVDHL